MHAELHPPLAPPKSGRAYEFISVCRVSDPTPGKQDERSLADQEADHRQWFAQCVPQPHNITVIAGSGSGEQLEREEYQRLISLIETRQFDLVLCEDLGRIVRRIHAHLMCELCEDCGTRLIAKNDRVDTALPNWRESSIFAAFHHERSNRDTSERIKRTNRNRFLNGGCLRGRMFGWVKPPGAKSDADMSKDPAAAAVYAGWFRMLDEDAATFGEVARWLRAQGIKFPSRYRDQWREPDGKSVARHTFNVLLKGVRERNRRKTRRLNSTGKYVSRKAEPDELLRRDVPHLAFFDASYYDRVIAAVRARNGHCRRSADPAADPCLNRPKKATRYPGRVTFCGVCNRPFVWGGHGQTNHLMCTGARMHRCWNGATFDGPAAAVKIAAAVLAEVEGLEDFDAVFLQTVRQEAERLDGEREAKLKVLRAQLQEADAGIANIVNFVRGGRVSPSLATELDRLESERGGLRGDLRLLEQQPSSAVVIPPIEQVKDLASEALKTLDCSDPEFARVMRRLVPRVLVLPYRLCDGGPMVLRAKFRLRLAELLEDRGAAAVLRSPLERVVTVNLFERPQRELYRQQLMASRATGKTEREAAEECAITVAAAQRAAALQRRMAELRVSDPYLPVLQPPEDIPKLRRHRHPDYRFNPLPGVGEP